MENKRSNITSKVLAALLVCLCVTDAFAMDLPSNRNPKYNSSINPKYNSSINPKYNSSINPKFNSSVNPAYNSSISPSYNSSINPKFNSSINPKYNSSLNPSYNSSIDPTRSSWSCFYISPYLPARGSSPRLSVPCVSRAVLRADMSPIGHSPWVSFASFAVMTLRSGCTSVRLLN